MSGVTFKQNTAKIYSEAAKRGIDVIKLSSISLQKVVYKNVEDLTGRYKDGTITVYSLIIMGKRFGRFVSSEWEPK